MYRVKFETFVIGGNEYVIRSLQDRQQFHDPKVIAESMGISSATWSLFGNVWSSGLILADIMSTYDVAGLHILEVGCGLGIASLIANERGAWHTASDHHPLAGYFLHENNIRNKLPPIHFERCDWAGSISLVGHFDLIQQFPISCHALFLWDVRDPAFVNFLEQSHDGTSGWPRYDEPSALCMLTH